MNNRQGALLAVVVLAVAGLVAFQNLSSVPARQTPEQAAQITEGRSRDAIFGAVKARIDRELLTPGAAKYSQPEFENVSPVRWRVYGTVDSQNAHGALLRKNYKAEVTTDGNIQVVEWHWREK